MPASPNDCINGKVPPTQCVSQQTLLLATTLAYLQVTILVNQNVTGFQIPMHNSSRVDVFQTTQDLVQEVLDELLFERTRCEKTVQIGTKELCDKVADRSAYALRATTHISSRGEMKISLSEIICTLSSVPYLFPVHH
jgi:hypothetical protein